jgi:hypothetical protein
LQNDVKLLSALHFSRSKTATEAELKELLAKIKNSAFKYIDFAVVELQKLDIGDTRAIEEAQKWVKEKLKKICGDLPS